jgi:hypothetical protein
VVTKKKENATKKSSAVSSAKKPSITKMATPTNIKTPPKSRNANPGMSADEKLTRRKLDALKRGIHRITDAETTPFSVHVLGVGKAGADIVAQILKDKTANSAGDESGFTALAVDIGDEHLAQVRDLASKLPDKTAQVETLALEMPDRSNLFNTLRRMREFLKLEYPRYYWNPNYEPWLPSKISLPEPGGHCARAVAKAIYAKSYYDDSREMRKALRRFADGVDNAPGQSVVAVVFGLGGGTGSGMTVDLARHLSSVAFGRRVLVVGIGIAPCDGDDEMHKGSHLFPALNELDCMGDESKNEGVVAVWGDLYRNPFTSGVIVVPQKAVWDSTQDLAATHQRIDREVSSFLTRNNGKAFWETLRLLNWVGAPPTQHAAARTPYGRQWAHVLGFADIKDGVIATKEMAARLGIRASYKPEFIEVRAANPDDAETIKVAETLGKAFSPDADPAITLSPGADPDSVQFILPCISKTDFELFYDARDQYDTQDWEEKLCDHAWLLDLGVLLCEPAIRFNGMAGECLWGCACWVVVPYDQIRGPEESDSVAVAQSKR